MKKQLFKNAILGVAATALLLSSCKKDKDENTNPPGLTERWVTVSGAKMETNPGDGNGGTMVQSLSIEDAKDPNKSFDVFESGFNVKSQRTARLQASEDGKQLFNIQYSGADGGTFNAYNVLGGKNYPSTGAEVDIEPYAGQTPRWYKLYDGDKTGVAVNVSVKNDSVGGKLVSSRGIGTILSLNLQNAAISGVENHELALDAADELKGHFIFRLDAPILNKAGNKLMVGTWMRKYAPGTTTVDGTSDRIGTKTVVVDYPSLKNPKIITSTQATGDNSGYRSQISYLGSDGYIYQATHRERAGAGGSKIIRIGQNNEYDNSYVLSLDNALSITDSYIESWRYAGNGIGYVLYRHGGNKQGYIARVDLRAKTATKIDLPGTEGLDFEQYQGIMINGDEVFVAVTPTGLDGNLYIFNSRTNTVTKGAKLINKAGNRYIGVY
ncbi:hypothetical protein [Polluticaenibacter yanchengensis]|uniref:DUF4374 domain-containing protein n=1 Tax=Polluticaenibacter yanchengensis TaxID=3014562 RepID=A0ABT4UMD9_9BACT|nr:hypothetical protein [Chitinophagaceae bacterium LY-5]